MTGWRSDVVRAEFRLDFGYTNERLVPAQFQLTGHEAVRRIGGIVLAEGAVRRESRRFEIPYEGLANLIAPRASLGFGRNGGGDRRRLHQPKECRRWHRQRASRRSRCSAARRCRAGRCQA
jgi:hypothetical protein